MQCYILILYYYILRSNYVMWLGIIAIILVSNYLEGLTLSLLVLGI
jgi:hypothetical protein